MSSINLRFLLIIGAGGFIGSICRYILSVFVQNKISGNFPLGTMMVNITGCLVIGLIFGYSLKNTLTFDWRLFLVTGICGGFTTFSAFSIETVNLLRNGQVFYTLSYLSGSVILGLLATWAGIALFRL